LVGAAAYQVKRTASNADGDQRDQRAVLHICIVEQQLSSTPQGLRSKVGIGGEPARNHPASFETNLWFLPRAFQLPSAALYMAAGAGPHLPRGVSGWVFGVMALSDDQLVVLVIEDDVPIQVVVEDALTDSGFEPAVAPSGEEAVTLLRGRSSPYCALVTDISLRGNMNGWEVARQAREIDPEFPVVYITAAHANQWASRGVPNSVLLTKPFAPAQLVTAVAELLNPVRPED
jgi:CheY-like chemotaxis protein